MGGLLLAVEGRFRPSRLQSGGLRVVGAALILASAFTTTDLARFPGLVVLFPTVGSCLVIAAGPGGATADLAGRLLAGQVLTKLGDLSYSWYLWHWPAIVFADSLVPGSEAVAAAAGMLALFPAWISYRRVELPLRVFASDDHGIARRKLLLTGATFVCALGTAHLASWTMTSVPVLEWFEEQRRPHLSGHCEGRPLERAGDGPNRCLWEAPGRQGNAAPRVYLLGDSNAHHLSEGLLEAASQLGLDLVVGSRSSCPFALVTRLMSNGREDRACTAYVDHSLAFLEQQPPSIVVLGSNNYAYTDGRVLPRTGAVPGESKTAVLRDGFLGAARRLGNAGHVVILVSEIPKPPSSWRQWNCSALLAGVDFTGNCAPAFRLADVADRLESAHRVFDPASSPSALVVHTESVLCPDGTCNMVRGQELLWGDGDHLSPAGSRAIAAWMQQQLARARASLPEPGRGQ